MPLATAFTGQDALWMARALTLARHGTGLCSPNPMVGCVIIDSSGTLAGEGWHEFEKLDHAEVMALKAAGDRARGGTAYVTLEPCNHTGRTGPCSQALVDAGIARVVAPPATPTPLSPAPVSPPSAAPASPWKSASARRKPVPSTRPSPAGSSVSAPSSR